MDTDQFEHFIRRWHDEHTRRGLMRLGAFLPLAGTRDAWLGLGDAAARKHRRNKGNSRKKKKCGKVGRKPVKGKCCKGLRLVDGKCSRPPCDVCASGCPHTAVQAAVDAAKHGDTLTLCAGTYLGNVVIAKDLTVIGVGDGADPASNSVLDGAGTGTVVTIASGADVTLQALRVTGGNGDIGGGIFTDRGGRLALVRCSLSGNEATSGGGIFNMDGPLSLSDCTVSGNAASGSGGGISHQGDTLQLVGSTVSGNTARLGGGLMLDGIGTVTLSDSTVSDNTSQHEGGGIHVDDDDITLTLTNCTVQGNTSGLSGGGMYSTGTVTLSNTTVRDNTANDPVPGSHGHGGGIVNTLLGVLTLEASTVTANHAAFDGGGVYNRGTVSCGDGSTISGNTALQEGTENCFDTGPGTGCATCPA